MADTATPPPEAPRPPDKALLAQRARAEQQRRQPVSQAAGRHSEADAQRLVQELQTHQIELEMQNEELLLAQAEARGAHARYVDLYDFAPVGYVTLAATGQALQLNLRASQLLGAVRAQLVGRRFVRFVAPAHRLEFGQFLARVAAAEDLVSCEVELLREDGTCWWARLEGLRTATADPAAGHCRLALLDISAQHAAAAALAASEARFRQLFTESADAVVLMQHHAYVDCNAAAVRLLGGQHKAQVVGQPVWALSPERQPDGRSTEDLFRDTVAAAQRRGSHRCEAVMRRFTGEEIVVEAVFTPIGLGPESSLLHVLWRDVTAQRRAEEELTYKSLVLERLLRHMPMVLARLTPDGEYLEAVGQGLAALGVTAHELVGRNMLEAFPSVQAPIRRVLQGEPVAFVSEIPVATQAVAFLNYGFFDEQRQQAVLLSVDVTEAERQKRELRAEQEFTRSILENSIDGIVTLDAAGRVTAWNSQAGRYFGRPAAAALGRPITELLPHADCNALAGLLARVLAGEQVQLPGIALAGPAQRYDASHLPLRQAGVITGVLIIFRDVTERDRLAEEAIQERLRRQQELLATIISTQESERRRIAEALHNGLGQLLYATKLSLQNLAGQGSAPAQALALLQEAIGATRTISFELTPGILEDFGLRIALEELLKRIGPAGLPVHLHAVGLEARLPAPVEIAVYRMVQELLNNVMKHAQATEVVVHVAQEAGRLEVTVEDNGVGFDPAVLAARPLAGIGLAGVRNRVALLGGTFGLNTQPGRGTIVSIELVVS